MRTLTCTLTTFIALFAAPATAGPPSACNSDVPCGILLVGVNSNGVPDPAGTFTIITRHGNNAPWSHGSVVLDFGACPDASICSVQVTTGVVVACEPGARTITAMPNTSGVITLTLVGGIAHRSTPATAGCLRIFAGGVLLTDGTCHEDVSVSALDESGDDGLGPADLSLWLADFFGPTYMPRSDFDHAALCDRVLGPGDLSRWIGSFFGNYTSGCEALAGTLCP